MPENNQTTLYALSAGKQAFWISEQAQVESKETERVLKRHLRAISMETMHVFQVICQQTQVSHFSNTWVPTKEELQINIIQWVVRGGQINANIGTYAL